MYSLNFVIAIPSCPVRDCACVLVFVCCSGTLPVVSATMPGPSRTVQLQIAHSFLSRGPAGQSAQPLAVLVSASKPAFHRQRLRCFQRVMHAPVLKLLS